MARQFHSEGAIVYAADMHPDGVPDGTRHLYVDVTDPMSVEAMISRTVSETGRLDVMCNNADAHVKVTAQDADSKPQNQVDQTPVSSH
jgi:NAD(P)-dependent dehydrogenase (short-subunit alcohol dehydrogenase family)